jgi:3-phenylpropionate/cinnamic acid dioxygenase small subunit
MTPASAQPAVDTLQPEPKGKRVATGSALYNQIVEYLYDEAAMLDQHRFEEWYQTLAEDLLYTAPLRITRQGPSRERTVIRTTQHYDEDYASIKGRLERLSTKSAWAEDPPSRTRRLVSNVRVWEGANPKELSVESYLLLTRNRYEHAELGHLSCVRYDVLRTVSEGHFKLARREIVIDQSIVGMPNIALFL